LSFLTDFWTFPFLFNALIATIGLSILCGTLSAMIVAKKYAFMGSSISHGALLGVSICMSFLNPEALGFNLFLFLGTLLITLIAVAPLAFTTFRQKLPSDALIGLFFTATMGCGILIHQAFGRSKGDLLGFLFGNVLTLSTLDLYIVAALVLIIVPMVWTKRLHWIHFIYNEEATSVQGLKTKFYHYTLFTFITLVIVAGLKISGVILINSFLLIPGIFALKHAPNALSTFTYSIVFAITTALIALVLANALNLPTGTSIAVLQAIAYISSLAFKRN
jgi:ABC-type Mn2+/Zn2+ transport system permease subunit